MNWAIDCVEHVLLLVPGRMPDQRLTHAIHVAKEWKKGNLKTGAAMQAAYGAHAAARDIPDPVWKAIAQSIGQAVSTAHMADHCVGAALYALKAVKQSGGSVAEERAWQDKQMASLPPELTHLVKETRNEKQRGFKDLHC